MFMMMVTMTMMMLITIMLMAMMMMVMKILSLNDHVDPANEGDLLPLVHHSDRPKGSVDYQ